MLWAQVADLDSPDELAIRAVRVEGNSLEVELEYRDFEGILGGNVREVGVLEARVTPAGAACELALVIARFGYSAFGRPETAEPREIETRRLPFSIG